MGQTLTASTARERSSDATASSLHLALTGAALLINLGAAALFAVTGHASMLVFIIPIGILPVIAVRFRHRLRAFRAVAAVVAAIYAAIAALFSFLGGLAFVPAMLLLLAASLAPDEQRARGPVYFIAMAIAALLVMAVVVVFASM